MKIVKITSMGLGLGIGILVDFVATQLGSYWAGPGVPSICPLLISIMSVRIVDPMLYFG